MSQPHPPRPDEQPPQQPSDPQEPRTQSIPVITPETQADPAAPPAPGPAFSTEAGWHPGGAAEEPPAPAAEPAVAPPPPVPPQQVPSQPFPPQPVPPEQVWPQPGWATPDGDVPGGDPTWPGQPTGPVDFVPGFGSRLSPPQPAGSTAATATGQLPAVGPAGGPAGGHSAGRLRARLKGGLPAGAARHRTVFTGLALGVIGLVLLELGLARDFGNASLWSVVPTWSAFATVAAVVALVPLVARWVPSAPATGTVWRIGLAGATGLAAFWVLVALPLVTSDRGFLLTAGTALAAAALWLSPGRPAGTNTGTAATGPGSTA
jgi:hypothetical protein